MDDMLAKIPAQLPEILVLLAVSLVTFGENRVHRYNYAFLTAVSGEELLPVPMRRYFRLVQFFPWLSWFSAFVLPAFLRFGTWQLFGLPLLIATLAFRVWSIRSLGRLWSQSCMFVPGMPRSMAGPYRYMKHPEYLARAVEGLGQLLFFGLNPVSIGLWIYIQMSANKICKVESRQLYELSVAPLQMMDGSSTVEASD